MSVRGRLVLGRLMVFGACLGPGACSNYVAVDRLDTYVASSFAPGGMVRPRCVRVADHINGVWQRTRDCRLVSGQVRPGGMLPLFTQAVNAKDLRTPIPGKRIDFAATDRDGLPVGPEAVRIDPIWVLTDAKGRNAQPIVVRPVKPGEYRIQLEYVDGGRKVIGMSPPLHVLGGGAGKP